MKYSVTFNGHTFTRKSDATYTHAAFNRDRKGNRNWVSFHGTYDAAKRAAGATGEVKPVFTTNTFNTGCIVCNGDKFITTHTATRGTVTVPCYRCNA
jgi:hypothetical protein